MAVIINGNNTPTAGGVGYGNGTELAFTGAGTSGQFVISGGASAPTFTSTPALGTPASGTLSSCTVDGTDAVGFRNIPINSNSAAYTAILADSGKVIFHPSTDANARTFTIPANASVAYALGTALTFINMTAALITRPADPINVLKKPCEIIVLILETSIHLSSTLILSMLISFITPLTLRLEFGELFKRSVILSPT